ncbi:hypothetical protein DEMA109039_13505 [Deinococcus marmoris]
MPALYGCGKGISTKAREPPGRRGQRRRPSVGHSRSGRAASSLGTGSDWNQQGARVLNKFHAVSCKKAAR